MYHIKELFKQSRVVYRLSWGNIGNMGEIVIKDNKSTVIILSIKSC